MKEDDGSGRTMAWFVVGSIAGACAACLLAPASGKRTRERLARKLRDTQESVADFQEDLADKTRRIGRKASRIGDRAARIAGEASAAARGVIDSLGNQTVRLVKRS